MANSTSAKPLTGRKVLIMLVAFFGTVTAVNIVMMYTAIDTFPGLVVQNSYVASQNYDAERDAQAALGWRAGVDLKNGVLTADIRDKSGAPVHGLTVKAAIGRPSNDADDHIVDLAEADGVYLAEPGLKQGIWLVEIQATGGPEERFRADARLYQPGGGG